MIRNPVDDSRTRPQFRRAAIHVMATTAALALALASCGDRSLFRPLPDVIVATDTRITDATADVAADARADGVAVDVPRDAPDVQVIDAGDAGQDIVPDVIDAGVIAADIIEESDAGPG